MKGRHEFRRWWRRWAIPGGNPLPMIAMGCLLGAISGTCGGLVAPDLLPPLGSPHLAFPVVVGDAGSPSRSTAVRSASGRSAGKDAAGEPSRGSLAQTSTVTPGKASSRITSWPERSTLTVSPGSTTTDTSVSSTVSVPNPPNETIPVPSVTPTTVGLPAVTEPTVPGASTPPPASA